MFLSSKTMYNLNLVKTYNCKIFKYSPKKTVVLKQCLINLKTGPL